MAIVEPTYSRDMLWVVDSGSSRYMTYLREAFTEYRVLDTPIQVTTANGACIPVIAEGTVSL
jgi:pyruvate/2-oxoglutarate/acetoin dehydrogenase E1 component